MKIVLVFFLFLGLSSSIISSHELKAEQNLITLEFSMRVNGDVYEMTDFGEPPQIAVWIQEPQSKKIKTVWITRRSGRRLWKGKIECPTALPLWESRHQTEMSGFKQRGVLKRLVDAFTGATPKDGIFKVRVEIARGEKVECFVEVNLSGDFNRDFPYRNKNGMPDSEVNGQPSLIYKGVITAEPGKVVFLNLIGRTDQWMAVDYIIRDTTGITSAKEAVTDIKVFCK